MVSTTSGVAWNVIRNRGWKRFLITARELKSYSKLVGAHSRLYRSMKKPGRSPRRSRSASQPGAIAPLRLQRRSDEGRENIERHASPELDAPLAQR